MRPESLVTFLELRIRHILPFVSGSNGVVGVTVSDHDDALHLRGDGRFVDFSADAHSPDERELLSSCFPSLMLSTKNFSKSVAVRIVVFGMALPESYSLMMALFLMVVVSCAWVAFLAILACVVHSVVFEDLVSRPASWHSASGSHSSDTDFCFGF